MSHGDQPSSWDPQRPEASWPTGEARRSGPEESAAIHPAARGDSIVATWGLLALGHILEAGFGTWALIWGGLPQRYRDPTPALATLVVITLLGWTGTAVTVRMLRTALDARRAIGSGRPPVATWPPPIVLTTLFAMLAVAAGVTAVFGWQALGVLPAIAFEIIPIPLAMRTERLLHDARGGHLE